MTYVMHSRSPSQFLGLLLITLLCCVSPTQAQRHNSSIGLNLRNSSLIVLADTQPTGANELDTLLTFREVLKGGSHILGQTYILPKDDRYNIEGPLFPQQAQGLAVIFGRREASGRLPIIEMYQTPQDIAALRSLISIYDLPTERQQLEALRARLNDSNPRFKEQLFDDLSRMRDRDSYPIFSSLYPGLNAKDQSRLLQIINSIGDLRGVPILIKAMSSPDHEVRAEAARDLQFTFPGAPGVNEAFQKALNDPDLAPIVADYLLKRDPNNSWLQAILAPYRSDWLEAQHQREIGRLTTYRAMLVHIIENPKTAEAIKCSAAEELLPTAKPALKARLRLLLLPLLSREATTGAGPEELSAAQVLHDLHHPACLPSLLILLIQPSSVGHFAKQVATSAVLDLGAQARRKAVAELTAHIKSLPSSAGAVFGDQDNDFLFTELACLGDADDYEQAGRELATGCQPLWQQARPLVGVSQQKDEGLFLLRILERSSSQEVTASDAVTDWAIFRLGDLRDKRAINPLFASLLNRRWNWDYDPHGALVKIGGPEVEKRALTLLTSEDRGWARDEAADLLNDLLGPKMLPLLRRMIREPDFGSRMYALNQLSVVGTPDDLKLLIPFADFWTGNRELHAWAMPAVAQIRERYNYDIHGPIKVH